jgi:hypothetical protein
MYHDFINQRPPPPKTRQIRWRLLWLLTAVVIAVVIAMTPSPSPLERVKTDFAHYHAAFLKEGHQLGLSSEPPVIAVERTLPVLRTSGVSLQGWRGSTSVLIGARQRLLIRVVSKEVCSALNGGPYGYVGDLDDGLSLMLMSAEQNAIRCYAQAWDDTLPPLFKGLFLGHPEAPFTTQLAFMMLPAAPATPIPDQI